MGKKLLRICSFFLTFVLLFGLCSHVLLPKTNSKDAGIHDPWAKGFLAEPENTIDVLFLGDSELYSCVAPLDIWETTGITAYNCGTSDQKPYQTESYLKRFFQTQTPGIVMLETNVLYRDYSTTDRIPHLFEEWFPLLRYHDRWKNLTVSDLTDPIRFTHKERDKGYIYQTEIAPADDSGYMIYSDEIAPISSKNIRHLQNILAFCQEQGAQLILLSSPSTVNWDYQRHNAVAQLAENLGIPYIDTNLMTEEVAINWDTDTRDHGDHLNYDGAKKLSLFLGEYLEDTGLFTDKRQNPDYDRWNRDLEKFHAEKSTS